MITSKVTRPQREKLALPQVTLVAASSVNLPATVRALETCLAQIDFAACKLFTDLPVDRHDPAIEVVPIAPLISSAAYSEFLLTGVVDHIATSHCLVAQWDGHVLDAGHWLAEFLDYDYVGARWPQFDDEHVVGNGGFSLRSRRLMEACRSFRNSDFHPEDIAICRTHRVRLEELGMRFAPSALADHFAAERAGDTRTSFGYHGVFLMPDVLGLEAFWQIYRELDDFSTFRHDFLSLVKAVGRGRQGVGRVARMLLDRLTGYH